MEAVNRSTTSNNGRRSGRLRRLAEAWIMALANHTPAGPASLATGQAGEFGRAGLPDQPDAREPGKRLQRRRQTYMQFAAPLRQVFWI